MIDECRRHQRILAYPSPCYLRRDSAGAFRFMTLSRESLFDHESSIAIGEQSNPQSKGSFLFLFQIKIRGSNPGTDCIFSNVQDHQRTLPADIWSRKSFEEKKALFFHITFRIDHIM